METRISSGSEPQSAKETCDGAGEETCEDGGDGNRGRFGVGGGVESGRLRRRGRGENIADGFGWGGAGGGGGDGRGRLGKVLKKRWWGGGE